MRNNLWSCNLIHWGLIWVHARAKFPMKKHKLLISVHSSVSGDLSNFIDCFKHDFKNVGAVWVNCDSKESQRNKTMSQFVEVNLWRIKKIHRYLMLFFTTLNWAISTFNYVSYIIMCLQMPFHDMILSLLHKAFWDINNCHWVSFPISFLYSIL